MAKNEWKRMNSRNKIYTSWERANLAYFWAYPDVRVMPTTYTEADGVFACEQAVRYFLSQIDDALDSHPTKQMHPDRELRQRAFDAKYPSASRVLTKVKKSYSDFDSWAADRATVDDKVGNLLKKLYAAGWGGSFEGTGNDDSLITVAIDDCSMSFKDISSIINDCPCLLPEIKTAFEETAKAIKETKLWN